MADSAVEEDQRLRRPGGIRSLRLGGTTATYVPDGAVQLPPRGWLPDTTDETWAAHPQYLDTSGSLTASIGGLLIETGDHALLIDAGFGPLSLPPDPATPRGAIHGGALLDNLAKLGRRPQDIEAVAFTHLHPDHIGWAWNLAPGDDQPAFAHASYLVTEPEWAQRHHPEQHGLTTEIITTLGPHVRTVTDGQEVFPGLHVRITGGHTPGHAEYILTAGGQRLIAFGDTLHSPIQTGHPEWSAAVDHDPAQSAGHRRRLIAELAEPGTTGFGIHFADVQFGHVSRDGSTPAWQPLDTDANTE